MHVGFGSRSQAFPPKWCGFAWVCGLAAQCASGVALVKLVLMSIGFWLKPVYKIIYLMQMIPIVLYTVACNIVYTIDSGIRWQVQNKKRKNDYDERQHHHQRHHESRHLH